MQKTAQDERKAEEAIRAIERAFYVSITLHDMRGTICHPSGKVLLPRRHKHRHRCCQFGRDSRPGWDGRCFKSCFSISEMEAASAGGPFLKHCWKGLAELVTPLIHESHHQLTIYAGVFRKPGHDPAPELKRDAEFMKLFDALPETPGRQRLEELGALLSFFGHGLLRSISAEGLRKDLSRGAAIRAFVAENAHRAASVDDLAKILHLSPSRASHAVKEQTGMSFQELLLKERIARAATLLESSRDPLSAIADKLGFKNEFYFNRVFKKAKGLPPGAFRRTRQRGEPPEA